MITLKQQVKRFRELAGTEVEACPFCRGEAEIYHRRNVGNLICQHEVDWWICCLECGGQTCMHESMNTAIEAWNTRASDDILTALTAAMEVIEMQREALKAVELIYEVDRHTQKVVG